MPMKTSELTGADLNKAVAECLGIKHTRFQGQVIDQFCNPLMYDDDWSLAGPIIEREKIDVMWCGDRWCAYTADAECTTDDARQLVTEGTTPLIAAMRGYVASKQGDSK